MRLHLRPSRRSALLVGNGSMTITQHVYTKLGMIDRGDQPGGGTPEQPGALTRTRYKTWGGVVKANNIRAD